MAVQQNKKSRSKRDMRRSHDALVDNTALTTDSKTGEKHRRHHIAADGTYRGRQIIKQKTEESDES